MGVLWCRFEVKEKIMFNINSHTSKIAGRLYLIVLLLVVAGLSGYGSSSASSSTPPPSNHVPANNVYVSTWEPSYSNISVISNDALVTTIQVEGAGGLVANQNAKYIYYFSGLTNIGVINPSTNTVLKSTINFTVLYRYRAEKPGKQQKSTSSTSRTMRNRKKNAVPITFSAAC